MFVFAHVHASLYPFFPLPGPGAKLLLVSKERIYDKSRPFLDELPTLKDVWCFDVDFHPRMKVRMRGYGGKKECRERGKEGILHFEEKGRVEC